jgi:chromate transporter
MNDQEFTDVLALANTLPGPIATKMAGYIGYRLGGILGMINAILATVMPTILMMLVLLTSFNKFKDNPRVQGMTGAVVPIVGVMMATLTWEFLKKSKNGWGWTKGLFLLAGSFIVMEIFHVNPGIVVAVLLVTALVIPDKKEKNEMPMKEKSESL